MINIEFNNLEYFKKVAELGNMTEAAKILMVSQPAISKAIKQLEIQIGYDLFERKGRNIYLNKNGEILLEYINKILINLDTAKQKILDINEENNTPINVNLLAASKLIPDILSKFMKLYPNIKINISQSIDHFNDADIVIYSNAIRQSTDNNKIILKEPIDLVVHSSHHLAGKKIVSLDELKDEEFVALKKTMYLRQLTDIYCKLEGFEPNIFYEVDNPSLLRELIDVGIGIAFTPRITWGDTNLLDVNSIEIENNGFFRYINISWSKDKYLFKNAQIFRDFVISYFENLK